MPPALLSQAPLQHRPQLPCPEPHMRIGPDESRVDLIGDPSP
ncbi:MAG: hypothetical protein WC620_07720 [Methanoregula sp.]